MNKHQTISKVRSFLEINKFTEKDFTTDSKTLTVTLTKSGTKRLSPDLEAKVLEMRVTIKKADGTTVRPEVVKNEIEKPEAKKTTESKEKPVAQKTEITFKGTLEVFSKKDLSGKSAKMGAATVSLTTLPETSPEGYNIIGVRKPGSSRIFYTTENRLPDFTPPTEAKVAEVLESVNTPIGAAAEELVKEEETISES